MKKILVVIGMLASLTAQAVWQPFMLDTVAHLPEKKVSLVSPFIQSSLAYRAFGDDKTQQDLDAMLFGKEFTIGDVFLTSKLANEGLLQIPGTNPVDNLAFLGVLSDAKVDIEAEQKLFRFGFDGAMTLYRSKKGAKCTLGFVLPFEYYEHCMNLNFPDSALGADNPVGRLNTFLQRYGSPRGFFERDVLGLKGLTFKEKQRSLGMGSAQVYAMMDFAHASQHKTIEHMQLGLVFFLPTGTNPDADRVWPIERGSSGSSRLGLYSNFSCGGRDFFNPFITTRIVGSFYTKVAQRVPKKYTLAANANVSTNMLINTTTFGVTHTLNQAIDRYETDIPFFADNAIPVKRKEGIELNMKVGNRIDYGPFKFSSWYYFEKKQRDTVKATSSTPAGTYNYAVVTNRTNTRAHSVAWELTYGLDKGAEFSLGSQHVLGGRNTPQYHTMMAAFKTHF